MKKKKHPSSVKNTISIYFHFREISAWFNYDLYIHVLVPASARNPRKKGPKAGRKLFRVFILNDL